VCGKREVDLEYLKANTRYRSPLKETDQHVKFFWKVLMLFPLSFSACMGLLCLPRPCFHGVALCFFF
jgi:hypothetical protein